MKLKKSVFVFETNGSIENIPWPRVMLVPELRTVQQLHSKLQPHKPMKHTRCTDWMGRTWIIQHTEHITFPYRFDGSEPDFDKKNQKCASICKHKAVRIAHQLIPSKRYSENSNLNLKFYMALCNASWNSYAKNEKNLFYHFLFIIISLKILISPWRFVLWFAVLMKGLMQKNRKIYSCYSNLCKLYLHELPETCGTHRSQEAWKG